MKIRKVNAKHHNLFTKSLNKMRFNAELPKAIGKPVLYDANIAEKVTQTAKESIRKFYNRPHQLYPTQNGTSQPVDDDYKQPVR